MARVVKYNKNLPIGLEQPKTRRRKMKKIVIAMFALAAFAGTAVAADVIELPASKGNVSFPHKKHQEMLKDCTKCHAKAPGKIAELDKDWAHKTCKGCHTEMKKGPTSCGACHKK
jgi:predicted CXXCH cytochrome family protein